ncbi:hypothetical protein WJX74_005015 [Apatococcus lobatus]|uniref:Protein YIPF n=2 Tax=Apatococcus TaxID=904362 RepID=A0AAW1SU91_9CHLO
MAQFAYDQQGAQYGQQSQPSVQWYQSAGEPYNTSYTYDTAGTSAAYGSFEEEAPLLEELGIDVSGILQKSFAVLLGRTKSDDLEDLDLGGPLIFAALLAAVHLLTGKLHFGVILGWSVVGSILIWGVVSSLTGIEGPDQKSLQLYSCCCLLGYCMLPMVVFAALALLVPRGSIAYAMAVVATLWCSRLASGLILRRLPDDQDFRDMYYLLIYPCVMVYSAFAILTVY